ncbi:MAG TPA: TOMM precursor leader peptide-binding protein [Thermoanaerobaculia bacterium]
MTKQRDRWLRGVRARIAGPSLVALDTRSGIELLEGRLSSAIAHWLNGEIIAQDAEALDSLDAWYEVDALRRRGLVEAEPVRDAPRIEVVADYLDDELEAVNAAALRDGWPWMLASPHGEIVMAGPVFVPGDGPCWMCLATRLREARAAWRLPPRGDEAAAAPHPFGLALADLEAARWTRHPDAPARLLTFDTRTLEQRSHAVVRLPHCAACGSSPRPFAPLVLESRTKAFTSDGGHRAAPPEETYARYEHLIGPLTGIVHHVERAAGDPGMLNVFTARHHYVTGAQEIPIRSFGKGMTAAQARAGALCEALERYCGTLRGDEPSLRSAYNALGDAAVHPHSCLQISERQYEEREEWNRHAPPLLWIPERFDESQETDWTPAWSLTHERLRYVPLAYCYYGASAAFARADSNGNAAGTCMEDAILQGLLELIERDAAGIWWYGRFRRPAVTTHIPYVEAMTREHAARGRQLRLLDITTDLGISVCAAISIGDDPQGFLAGFGAHLDPRLALTRAVTEANQLLAIQRIRRPFRGDDPDWSFLEPEGSRALSSTIAPSNDLRTDVLAIVDALRALELEVLVVDQTREEIALPVVKVIVPGLRHFRPRFAAGRLYDVPHRLGWTPRPLREEELNPAHLTI